jgi:predicted alpha/beta-hydrolase family hydrolase
MGTPFMAFFAEGLGKQGYRVVRFECPYMATRRATGKQKPADKESGLRSKP